MRIALIYDAAYPWMKGGGEKTLWDIALEMRRLGHEVHYFSVKLWEGPDVIERDGITFHGVSSAQTFYTATGQRSFTEPVNFALGLFRALWQCETKFDFINCTVFPYFSVFSVWLVRLWRLPRTPWLLSWLEVWGADYWKRYLNSSWKGTIGFMVEWLCARCSRNHLVISGLQARRLHRLLGVPHGNIEIVPRGIEAAKLTARQCVKEPQRVIYAGRLLDYKNVETVVRAWPAVLLKHPATSLRIIGSGPTLQRLNEIVRELRLDESVSLCAPKDSWEEIITEISAAEIFVQPSLREGQGVTTLEAMAVGAVVIASQHEGSAISDYLRDGENGLAIANWADPAAWADAISQVLADSSLHARLAEEGRRTALEYDWRESITPRMDAMLKKIAKAE